MLIFQTGVIETKGYYESGDTTDEHPVSHIKMIGFQFPKWDELLEMLNEVATNMISTINYIGWDVAYTPKGWVIIEGNFFGQHLWQIVYEHGTEKEVGDILGWHIEEINIGGNIIKRSFKRKLVLLNISVYKSIQTPIFEKSMFR